MCSISGDFLLKKRFRIEILLRFYSICLLFAGMYSILKKRIRRISVLRGQRAVYAARRICRQKGLSNSVHDFRKGIQVQTKAQPVKTGVAKPDGPKRRVFLLRMAAGCRRYFVTPLQSYARCKGGIFIWRLNNHPALPTAISKRTNHLCYSVRSKLYRQGHHR